MHWKFKKWGQDENVVTSVMFLAGAESFRMPRQVDAVAEAVEEKGTFTKITDTIKSYYNNAVDSVTDGLESFKGLKLEEKAQ